jgi:hypothetical protein
MQSTQWFRAVVLWLFLFANVLPLWHSMPKIILGEMPSQAKHAVPAGGSVDQNERKE